MSLTDRQKANIQNALNAKGVRALCPMCTRNQWELANDFVAGVPTHPGAGMALGGSHIPLVQLICTNCGFVSHHAAGVLGIPLNP